MSRGSRVFQHYRQRLRLSTGRALQVAAPPTLGINFGPRLSELLNSSGPGKCACGSLLPDVRKLHSLNLRHRGKPRHCQRGFARLGLFFFRACLKNRYFVTDARNGCRNIHAMRTDGVEHYLREFVAHL